MAGHKFWLRTGVYFLFKGAVTCTIPWHITWFKANVSWLFIVFIHLNLEIDTPKLKCHYDQIFTSWFFRCITKNSMKEWKRLLPFANTCVSSGDNNIKCVNIDMRWLMMSYTQLNITSVYKQSYLGQFAVQTNETW